MFCYFGNSDLQFSASLVIVLRRLGCSVSFRSELTALPVQFGDTVEALVFGPFAPILYHDCTEDSIIPVKKTSLIYLKLAWQIKRGENRGLYSLQGGGLTLLCNETFWRSS